MILGSGDIASALNDTDNGLIDRDDVIFFACGVSNSKETHPNAYQRELCLLMKQDKSKHIVYFSSLCIYYLNTEYARHKRIMENTIRNHFESFTIVRIGNIEWGKNPHTLINFLKANPYTEPQPVWRHILSLKEFQYWMKMIMVPGKDTMNLPGRMVWVPHLMNDLKGGVSVW